MGQANAADRCSSYMNNVPQCIVAKGTRLITKYGIPRVEELSGKGTTVWTGHRWVQIRVEPSKSKRASRISLSDGSELICPEHTQLPVRVSKNRTASSSSILLPRCAESPKTVTPRWAESPMSFDDSAGSDESPGDSADLKIIARWVPVDAGNLKIGDRIIMRSRIPAADIQVDTRGGAVVMGTKIGELAHSKQNCGIPEIALGYSRGETRGFVDGWSAARQGSLSGTFGIISDLQMLVGVRGGVKKTYVERTLSGASLYVHSRELWTRRAEDPRKFDRRLKKHHTRVVGVEWTGKITKMYTIMVIDMDDTDATTVAVNNTIIVAKPASLTINH